MQIRQTLQTQTNISARKLCCYSGAQKSKIESINDVIVLSTYAMFSATNGLRSKSTKHMRSYVMKTKWDLVILDEVHHSLASTYRPLVSLLQQNSKRVLGFTATQPVLALDASDPDNANGNKDAMTLGFLNRVLFKSTCAQEEEECTIAKTRCMQIDVPMPRLFADAHEHVSGTTRVYLQSINPNKLVALKLLVHLHKLQGHIGIVFADHLMTCKVIRRMLGPSWAVLSASSPNGERDSSGAHSIAANARLLKDLKNGTLDGLISTSVGAEGLDIVSPNFCFAVLVDNHAGKCSSLQRIGRLSRTRRLQKQHGESHEAFLDRCRQLQKHAAYYELVSKHTEEESAAAARALQLRSEGYDRMRMSYEALLEATSGGAFWTGECSSGCRGGDGSSGCGDGVGSSGGARDWRFSQAEHVKLLVEAVSYNDLGKAETQACHIEKESMHQIESVLRRERAKLTSGSGTNKLFKVLCCRRTKRVVSLCALSRHPFSRPHFWRRFSQHGGAVGAQERAKSKLKKIKKVHLPVEKERAKLLRQKALSEATLCNSTAAELLRTLNVCKTVLDEAGISLCSSGAIQD
jgi:superfamily II DNA or RNA helicase